MGCVNCKDLKQKGYGILSKCSDSNFERAITVTINKTTANYTNVQNNLLGSDNSPQKTNKKTDFSTSPQFKRNKQYMIIPSILMLKEINNARENPSEIISKIENLKNNIFKAHNKFYIKLKDQNGNIKNFVLKSGFSALDNTINYLKNISKSNVKLEKLVMSEELKIPFPIGRSNLYIDKNYIKNIVNFKILENKEKFKILDFHYDICIDDPSASVLMQIIDDTNDNFQRRKNIFNPKAKFIGISDGEYGNNLRCFYLLFGDKDV